MHYKIVLLVMLLGSYCAKSMAYIVPDNACELPDQYTCVADVKYYKPGDTATRIEACMIAIPQNYLSNNIIIKPPITVEASSGLPENYQHCVGDRYYENGNFMYRTPFYYVVEYSKCPEIPGANWAGKISRPDGTLKCVLHKQYRAIQLKENTPPKCEAAGNPIKLATGEKVQAEQVLLEGMPVEYAYGSTGSSPTDRWQQKPDELRWGDKLATRNRSSIYTSKAEACMSGFAEFKNRAPVFSDEATSWRSATAEYTCDTCLLKRDNKIISVLGIIEEESGFQNPRDVIQHLRPDGGLVNYFRACGSASYQAFGSGNDQQKLQQVGQDLWQLDSPSGKKTFDTKGYLSVTYTSTGQLKNRYTYNAQGDLTSVQNDLGQQFNYHYTAGQLNSIQAPNGKTLQFGYTGTLLTKVTHPDQTTRLYHYEDPRFPNNLTGITDERGIRYATWKYDDQGRAISSEHAGGAEKTSLFFNPDGSTTVTNALGKKTTYSFTDILGVRRVNKVTGEPTANCVGANQAYTYTPQGLLESKTDWNGTLTKFTYDNFSRELTRTQAFGTADATTVQTCWHETLNQPARIIEATRITLFDYTATGQLKSQTIKPRPQGSVDCATAL